MKKRLAFLATILCAAMFTTSVSAASTSPRALYMAAVEKTIAAPSMQTSGTMKMKVTSDIAYEYTMRERTNEKGELELSLLVESKSLGIEMAAYYKDGYLYTMAMDGTKTRVKMASGISTGIPGDLTDKAFDAAIEQVSGGQRIKAKVPIGYINSILGGALGSVSATTLPGGTYGSNSDMTATYTIGDNGYLQSQNLTYSLASSGRASKIKYTVTMKYSHFGSIDKIDFPPDLDSYKTIKA